MHDRRSGKTLSRTYPLRLDRPVRCFHGDTGRDGRAGGAWLIIFRWRSSAGPSRSLSRSRRTSCCWACPAVHHGLMETFGLKPRSCLPGRAARGGGAVRLHDGAMAVVPDVGFLVGVGACRRRRHVGRSCQPLVLPHRGLAMGLSSSANAAGQLIFLPLLGRLAQDYGWQSVSITVSLTIATLIPFTALLLPDHRRHRPRAAGAAIEPPAPPRTANPFALAIDGLVRGMRSLDFWLLAASFGIGGFSTNGLISTHLIAFCVDHGYTQFAGAGILGSLGLFSLIGSTASGWLTDRYNPRILLFWMFGLRGLSLMLLPYTSFDTVSLTVFAVFYGLDWIAVMPPIFALMNEVFGSLRRR